ncbi:beta-galactosidase [Trifolium repens]|nr:beta-galactosidase [Trifolium repens]
MTLNLLLEFCSTICTITYLLGPSASSRIVEMLFLTRLRFVFIETEQCKRDSKVSYQGDKLSYGICRYCSR